MEPGHDVCVLAVKPVALCAFGERCRVSVEPLGSDLELHVWVGDHVAEPIRIARRAAL